MKRALFFIAVVTALLVSVQLQGAKPPADQPATAAFRCGWSSFVLTCPAGAKDGIAGDGAGRLYGAVLNVNRELHVQLTNGGGRYIWLDFTDGPVRLPGARRDFDTLLLDDVTVQTNVVDSSGAEVSGGLLSIGVGSSSAARLKIIWSRLNSSGQTIAWAVRFNPEGYPGSDHVTITRPSNNTWQIEATSLDRALLHSSVPHSKNYPELLEGPFYMPFKMTVTSPPVP